MSERGRPTVSIGLPVFNGEKYLEQAVASILAQSFEDFELIVSDNASTDNTYSICLSLASQDDRIRLHRSEVNRGAAANYNRVFRLSRGRYFKWAAHDDLLKPEFLRACIDVHQGTQPAPSIVYPKTEFIDSANLVTHLDADTQQTHSRHPAVRAFQVLQRMSMAHAVFGLFNASLLGRTDLIGSFVSSDYVLLLQMALLGDIIQLQTEPLFQRRVHPEMSRVANRTTADVLKWFDPSATTRLSEQNRLRLEYVKSPYTVRGLGRMERHVYASAIALGFTRSYIRAKRGTALR